MSLKTKNILRNIGFLLSIPVLIGAFVFAVSKDKGSVVQAIDVHITNSNLGFVTPKDVQRSLLEENVVLGHSVIEALNISALEEKINANPWVEEAEVFVSSKQNIEVKLTQVKPKLRVQRTDSTANGYYLDAVGSMIPLSRKYSADLPILTTGQSIATQEKRKELVDFAQYIEQDTFWHATIAQINLDKKNDIELVSLIGDANIRFGAIENVEDKFFRLFQFYKKGINRINWNNVKELDLRFDNQLVCRRYHKEKHIEEIGSPILYAKTKPQFVPTKASTEKAPLPKAVTSAKKAASTAVAKPGLEVPKRRKVVTKNVWKEDNSSGAKKEEAKKVAKKKVVKKKPQKKVAKTSKKSTTKKTVKKTVAKATAKPTAKPKRTKKKPREIIINTEPVTKK